MQLNTIEEQYPKGSLFISTHQPFLVNKRVVEQYLWEQLKHFGDDSTDRAMEEDYLINLFFYHYEKYSPELMDKNNLFELKEGVEHKQLKRIFKDMVVSFSNIIAGDYDAIEKFEIGFMNEEILDEFDLYGQIIGPIINGDFRHLCRYKECREPNDDSPIEDDNHTCCHICSFILANSKMTTTGCCQHMICYDCIRKLDKCAYCRNLSFKEKN